MKDSPKTIRNLGLADGREGPAYGQYLKEYDPSALGGMGDWKWTPNRDEAIKFPNAAAVFKAYNASPKCHPTRPDGKPNKPLTAFNILVEDA